MVKKKKIKIITAVSLFATIMSLFSIGYASWTISDPGLTNNNVNENGSVEADQVIDITKGITVSLDSIFTFGTYNFVDSNGDTQSSGLLTFKIDINYAKVDSKIKTESGFVANAKIFFGNNSKDIFASSFYQGLTFAPTTGSDTFECASVDITPANTNNYRQYQLTISSSSNSGLLIFTFKRNLVIHRDYILNGTFHLYLEGVEQ